jgi:hypothetical protein
MEARPPELASLGNSLKPLRYNSPDCPVYTGLSGEPRSNGYFRANGYVQAHSMRASGAQSSGAPILVHRTMNSSCPVYTGHPGGSTVRSSNGQNPTAMLTWQGAPDCPVCTGLSGAPSNRQGFSTATFGGWGYKYPNHPTIHCIQVFHFPTTTRAITFNSRHTPKRSNPLQFHSSPL